MRKFAYITFIPVILGIIMLVLGSVADIYAMRIAAVAVLFGGSFSVAVICVIVMFVKGKNNNFSFLPDGEGGESEDDNSDGDEGEDDDDEDSDYGDDEDSEDDDSEDIEDGDGDDESGVSRDVPDGCEITEESEREAIERVNSSGGMQNAAELAEWQLKHVKQAGRAASKKSKKYAALFVCWLMLCFVGGVAALALGSSLGSKGVTVTGFVLLGCFAATIICAAIVITSLQRISLRGSNFEEVPHKGTVTSCTVSSSTSVGGRRHYRITNVVYRITLSVDGEEKTAYSYTVFKAGDEVTVLFHRKFKKLVQIKEY